MLVTYTYPTAGKLYLSEHWPIWWDRYRITWTVIDKTATAVSIAVKAQDLSQLPRVEPSAEPGVAAHIYVGHQPYHDEVESILRTACGLLALFSDIEVDFGRPTIAWEAETAEERAKLTMHSWTIGEGTREDPLPIGFDLVARCFYASTMASGSEIPLSFLAKGRRDLITGRYIDAYYSFFFFLETQFAPGYSNPHKVSERFKASTDIAEALNVTRSSVHLFPRRSPREQRLLALTDDALIDHLVDTRGRLHHHALRRGSGSWHPERHNEFEAEAHVIAQLTNQIAMQQNIPLLFDDAVTKQLSDSADAAGAKYEYLVDADGGGDRYGLNGLPKLKISLPTRAPSHSSLWALESGLRREGGPYESMAVRSYEVRTSDGSQILSRYANNTFPPKPLSRRSGPSAPDTR